MTTMLLDIVSLHTSRIVFVLRVMTDLDYFSHFFIANLECGVVLFIG